MVCPMQGVRCKGADEGVFPPLAPPRGRSQGGVLHPDQVVQGAHYLAGADAEGQKMIQIARNLGIWGEPLKLHRKLSQSARGTVIRIPADIEKNMKLKGDEKVLISKIGKNKLLIEIVT